MTAFVIAAPPDWNDGVRRATAGWPPGVTATLSSGPVSLAQPAIRISVTETTPTPWPAPDRLLLATAHLIGHRPMTPDRFSAFVRRTDLSACSVADPERAAEADAAWPTGDRAERTDLAPTVRAAHMARAFVRDRAEGFRKYDDVVLATSELAANAIQHGGGPIALQVWSSPGSFVVEMVDSRPTQMPALVEVLPTSTFGRGMAIVDAVADHWGVTVLFDRKVVWAEFTTATANDTRPSERDERETRRS